MRTIDDFTPGDVVRFLATPDHVYTPPRRWAAPAGALARVVAIDMTWWYGVLVVEWLDRSHGQDDGGYSPELFEPHHTQPDLLEMLGEVA